MPLERPFVVHTLRTLGLGESYIEELIDAPLKPLTDAGLGLGYCARMGEVELRFVGEGERAAELVAEAERIVHGLLGPYIYANEDESLEASIVRKLTELNQTVAFAESCTGGYVSNRITNVPGASRVLLAGLVTYSNEAKQKLLGVAEATLKANGAVSEPTAREMAEGARRAIGSDYAISITGIAGPDGGSVEKPVGTVFIALASAKETLCVRMTNRYDRETFKYVTSNQALDLLRRALNGLPPLTAN
jgi:nicotinamide-nucleotide amidase